MRPSTIAALTLALLKVAVEAASHQEDARRQHTLVPRASSYRTEPQAHSSTQSTTEVAPHHLKPHEQRRATIRNNKTLPGKARRFIAPGWREAGSSRFDEKIVPKVKGAAATSYSVTTTPHTRTLFHDQRQRGRSTPDENNGTQRLQHMSHAQVDAIQCREPSAYIYWHVMKTGGLAVDEMLECACKQGPRTCAIWHRDGSNSLKGDRKCAERPGPSVLTTHGTPNSLDLHEGQLDMKMADLPDIVHTHSWANASNITILRHPVARVWSYYAYARQNDFPPFKEQSLAYFLSQPHINIVRQYGGGSSFKPISVDPATGEKLQINSNGFELHQSQLFNRMTRVFGQQVGA